jgi:DNA-binding CsgD family transcriptional regulator
VQAVRDVDRRPGEPGRSVGLHPLPALDAHVIEHELVQLLVLERELTELAYVRRADALERVSEAIRRLAEFPAGSELPAQAAAEFGQSSEFSRVLISEVTGDRLILVAAWEHDNGDDPGGGARDEGRGHRAGPLELLSEEPLTLEYPLHEHELIREQGARLIDTNAGERADNSWTRQLGLGSYVVAAIVAGSTTIGLVHADDGERQLDQLDCDLVARFAAGLSGVMQRAVLRHTLELHRAELSAAAQWMGAAARKLGDRDSGAGSNEPPGSELHAVDELTTREREVLQLLAQGLTNREIAHRLVVREGTVKYHVKNILRKLGAVGRTDAVSRYLRATARERQQ